MRSLRLLLLVGFLLGTALAGCASKATTGSQTSTLDGVDVNATETTGVIRGIVVDTAIRPLMGVHLSIKAGDTTLTTDSLENGGFGFADLAPGTYFIDAQKPGYNPVRVSTDVVANDNSPALVRVQLEPNPTSKPFVEPFVFKGFMDCSTTTAAPGGSPGLGIALCSVPNGLTCGLDPVPCSPNVTADNTQTTYSLARVPTWVQSEMVWDSTQDLGKDLSLMYSWECGQENAGFPCDHDVEGPSPLLLTANATAIEKAGIGTEDLWIRVFNTGAASTQSSLGMTLQQGFTIYTHIFYGFAPPEGYRFSADGAPVVPE